MWEMDENSAEIEEGEACYYDDGDAGKGSNIDPDIDLSYIVRALCLFDVRARVKFGFWLNWDYG